MTDDAAKKKRELEHELTLTMTAQVSYMKLVVLLTSECVCPYPPHITGVSLRSRYQGKLTCFEDDCLPGLTN